MSKVSKVIIVLLALAAIGGMAYTVLASRGTIGQEQEPNATAIQGEIACLPLKDESGADTQCQLGLRNDKDMYLELQNVSQETLKSGAHLEATGSITPPTEDNKYDVVGVMKVDKTTTQ